MMYKIVNNLVDMAVDKILILSRLHLKGHTNITNTVQGQHIQCIPSFHKQLGSATEFDGDQELRTFHSRAKITQLK